MSHDMSGSTPSAPLKRTPLRDVHVEAGAKMVPFGGWEMPVQYAGILEEHRAVRNAAGLFDISHMGEFEVRGPAALAAIQRLTTNDAAALEPGHVQYSLLCQDDGGIVDDLTLYRMGSQHWMLVVNAAGIPDDWRWVTEHEPGEAWKDVSEDTALLAVQGPRAEAIVQRLASARLGDIRYYHFAKDAVAGVPTVISRTGYTGEDGFELYVPASEAVRLWKKLLEEGRPEGLVPVGLGARDTLRLEMRYALYGNDIDRTTNPLEAGLGWVVKPAKGDFIGRAAIEAVRARGPARKLVGFEMVERAVPRHGYPIVRGDARAGEVTSGSFSPSLERGIGLGYVRADSAAVGTELGIEIRGAAQPARVAKTPFVPSHVKKG
jgi:aminomethyltransferase